MYQKTMKIVARNNNIQNVRDKFLKNLVTWKSIELMLLVIYNDVIKS